MTTSPRYQSSRPTVKRADMEFQTPAVSEKFQSRFGWRSNNRSEGEEVPRAKSPEGAEEAGGSGFHPIRSQIPIPTAHVMPSASHNPPRRPHSPGPAPSKSASSPDLAGADGAGGGATRDCLSRYRSLVNGLDHTLFGGAADQSHVRFETPPLEPTLNQSGLLGDPGPHGGVAGSGADAPDRGYGALPRAWAGPRDDADDWRQKFEGLRAQVEQMQLLAGPGGRYPPPPSPESSRWEAAVKLSENLLKEKELVIDRQQQQLYQLEQRLRESEVQIHGALMGRGAPLMDVCLLRLQEAQRENTFLRAQFAERTDALAQEKLEAELRLGAVEADTQRLSESLKDGAERHGEEMKKQDDRIRNRDKHIANMKKKCQKEAEQNREKQQRIETLERYLADLPTMEDYQSQRKQLEATELKVGELQGSVLDLETQLREARSTNRIKDAQLEEQKRRERELLATVTRLQARVQEGLDDGARLPSLDLEELKEENASLKEEQQKLKKVTEKQLRMIEQLSSRITNVQQQLGEEESSTRALRDELDAKEQERLQLHCAVKEMSEHNQELMEQSVCLRERLQLEAGVCEVALTQQLLAEMASCLSDLRSLCGVLTHTAHGQDPNLSLLLGISSATFPAPCEDWSNPAVLQKKLQEALQLRRDVEELRNTVSDRYAQDMGENCTTQ